MGTAHFEVQDPQFEARVRESFARQGLMPSIGAEIVGIAPGKVDIALPYRADLTQQHGYLHAGVVTAIVDNACGYAALSLLPANLDVLTVEYKVNFLAPAQGSRFIARGWVKKAGRRIIVSTGDVFAEQDAGGDEQLVATMLSTITTIRGQSDRPDAAIKA